jgi:DNA-binding MarR family transcriptional regulator
LARINNNKLELSKPLGYMLGRSLRVFKNQLISEFRERKIDLSFEQFIILHILNSNCKLIQQDLANYLQKDKSIIVRQIDFLLDNQLVVRLTNQSDKRKRNLILTENGIEILNQMKKIALEVSDKLLSGVSENELETFRNVLMKIQENGKVEDRLCN